MSGFPIRLVTRYPWSSYVSTGRSKNYDPIRKYWLVYMMFTKLCLRHIYIITYVHTYKPTNIHTYTHTCRHSQYNSTRYLVIAWVTGLPTEPYKTPDRNNFKDPHSITVDIILPVNSRVWLVQQSLSWFPIHRTAEVDRFTTGLEIWNSTFDHATPWKKKRERERELVGIAR
jgi:hypothetical protein